MKKFIVFFGALLICGVAAAQEKIDFYKFIESIDWNSTREQFVEKHRNIILPDSVRTSNVFTRGDKDIFIQNICIGDIAIEEVIIRFDTLANKLINISMSYSANSDESSDNIKYRHDKITNSLNDNIGEPFCVAFYSYYFHNNCVISDMKLSSYLSSRFFKITPPAPRYEKDFRVANWGDSKEKIRDLEGRMDESGGDRDAYGFEDRLGDLKCIVIYKFANDKLIWAKYMFEDIEDDKAIYHYNRFEKMLDRKYGVVSKDGTHWKDGKYEEEYKDKEIEAIKKEYRKRYKFWCNGPTEVFMGIIDSDNTKNGWYLTIEYHSREMEKIQEQAVFDAL
ncbi:MAG: hypothetical protein IJX65_02005 [Alistipes sp.]|nr:hypothetical protein [Alistipes sp.]